VVTEIERRRQENVVLGMFANSRKALLLLENNAFTASIDMGVNLQARDRQAVVERHKVERTLHLIPLIEEAGRDRYRIQSLLYWEECWIILRSYANSYL
jgi:hypothetical protein